ncbi:hypothetical protein EHP00_1315 [Ecytonucleospora hepatopenaei]|uniref:Uncharacterized protein n=1 Tax=Ecytonucleospora hepatopenaei TaxID=646526 RepID=A0A1W0E5F3_9MICR|nr:hypothetical protein EHP00_1315 [Ecytonucleospora hepatopenaei]
MNLSLFFNFLHSNRIFTNLAQNDISTTEPPVIQYNETQPNFNILPHYNDKKCYFSYLLMDFLETRKTVLNTLFKKSSDSSFLGFTIIFGYINDINLYFKERLECCKNEHIDRPESPLNEIVVLMLQEVDFNRLYVNLVNIMESFHEQIKNILDMDVSCFKKLYEIDYFSDVVENELKLQTESMSFVAIILEKMKEVFESILATDLQVQESEYFQENDIDLIVDINYIKRDLEIIHSILNVYQNVCNEEE